MGEEEPFGEHQDVWSSKSRRNNKVETERGSVVCRNITDNLREVLEHLAVGGARKGAVLDINNNTLRVWRDHLAEQPKAVFCDSNPKEVEAGRKRPREARKPTARAV